MPPVSVSGKHEDVWAGVAAVAAALADVAVVAGVAAAATPDDGPISTSKAKEAAKHAAPITTANPPSFCTAGSMRRG